MILGVFQQDTLTNFVTTVKYIQNYSPVPPATFCHVEDPVGSAKEEGGAPPIDTSCCIGIAGLELPGSSKGLAEGLSDDD